MARKKSGSGESGGANWMDTYGDMVTLLMTFFVLLYSFSSVDAEKWKLVVQAFSTRGSNAEEAIDGIEPNDSAQEGIVQLQDGELPQSMDQLFEYIKGYIEDNGLSDSVTVEKGVSNIYLKFRDNIFFAGDSDVLLAEGKAVLSGISSGIKSVEDKILAIRVCGHTAEGKVSKVSDTELSAGRAVNVSLYLQEVDACDPKKLISMGYGKYRPIASNDTEENRRKNRRVEIVIIRKDADFTDPAVIEEYLKMEFGAEYITPDELLDSSSTAVSTEATETTTTVSSEG